MAESGDLNLSDEEWDLVFRLADAERRGELDLVLSELGLSEIPARVNPAFSIQKSLAEASPDPDEHWSGPPVGGRIQVRSYLQDGGSAAVYLGVRAQDGLHQPVALKMFRLPRGREERAARLAACAREEALLVELSRTGTVPPFLESGCHRWDDGTEFFYLCTEYKHGLSLTRWCDEHAVDLRGRLRLFVRLCELVATLHRHGLVHGDLKPSNVQVERVDGGTRVWLLDLGLATPGGRAWNERGALAGTPGYMSPEHLCERYGPVSDATDIYALGVILFELIEGCPWIQTGSGRTAPELLSRIEERAQGARLRSVKRRRMRVSLERALGRATALEPRDRYARVSALCEAVQMAAPELGGSNPDARGADPARRAGRSAGVFTAASAALALGALAALFLASAADPGLDRLVEQAFAPYHESQMDCGIGGAVRYGSEQRCVESLLAGRLGVDVAALRRAWPRFVQRLRDAPDATLEQQARAAYLEGEYREAEQLSRDAVERALGADPPDLRSAVRTYELAARAAQGRGAFERALKHLQAAHGLLGSSADPVPRAQLESLRAFVLYRSGAPGAAEQVLLSAMPLQESELGAEHPSSQQSRNLYAAALAAQGRYAEAEREYRRVLEFRERTLGPRERATWQSRHNLATALQGGGRLPEAAEEYRRVVRSYLIGLGATHRATLQARHNLATTLEALGKMEGAESEYRLAVDGLRVLLGDGHPTVLRARGNLAHVLAARGKEDVAKPMQREVFAASERHLGPGHPDTLRSQIRLARMLSEEARPGATDEALRLVYQARLEARRSNADTAEELFEARCLYAHLLDAGGQHAEARDEYESLLAAFPTESEDAARADRRAYLLIGLSWQQLLTGDFSEALTSTERGLHLLSVDPELRLKLELNRAHSLLLLGDFEDARSVYRLHRSERLDSGTTWEEAALRDLEVIERAGLSEPELRSSLREWLVYAMSVRSA